MATIKGCRGSEIRSGILTSAKVKSARKINDVAQTCIITSALRLCYFWVVAGTKAATCLVSPLGVQYEHKHDAAYVCCVLT